MAELTCNPIGSDPFNDRTRPWVNYDGNGSTKNFAFAFPFLGQADYIANYGVLSMSKFIEVWTRNGDGPWSKKTTGIKMGDNVSVTFTTAPAVGTDILIKRNSRVEQILVQFTSSSPITTGTNDLTTNSNIAIDSTQIHYLLQELFAAILDLDCALTTVNDFAGNVYYRTGDGSWTTLPLNATYSSTGETSESGLLEAQVQASIAGSGQQLTSFAVADVALVSTVTFDVAPPDGYQVEIRILSGAVVPNVEVADGSITCAKLADGSLCSLAKFGLDSLATNKQALCFANDGSGVVIGIRSMDHTYISDFDTQVRTSTLSQMAVPTLNVSMNTHKITNVVDPTSNQDAATKKYVDDQIDLVDTGMVFAKGTGTLSGGGVSSVTVVAGFEPSFVIIYWTGVTMGGSNATINSAMFANATTMTAETLRAVRGYTANPDRFTVIVHNLILTANGFTYSINNDGLNFATGTIGYVAFA